MTACSLRTGATLAASSPATRTKPERSLRQKPADRAGANFFLVTNSDGSAAADLRAPARYDTYIYFIVTRKYVHVSMTREHCGSLYDRLFWFAESSERACAVRETPSQRRARPRVHRHSLRLSPRAARPLADRLSIITTALRTAYYKGCVYERRRNAALQQFAATDAQRIADNSAHVVSQFSILSIR